MNLRVKIFLLRIAIVLSSLISGLTVIAVAVYCYAWVAYVGQAQNQIDITWKQAPAQYDLTITGDRPDIGGFPLTPRVSYTGRITHNPTGFYVDIPELTYQGFPAPTQIQELTASKGFVFKLPFLNRDITVKSGALKINWPRYFPMQLDNAGMKAWQKQNDPFVIHAIQFNTADVKASGNGMIGLDETLLITGYLNLRIVGLENLLTAAEADNTHTPHSMDTARKFLSMLSRTDPATGEVYFETTLRFEDKGIFFGPMRIGSIPDMPWEGTQAIEIPRRQKP